VKQPKLSLVTCSKVEESRKRVLWESSLLCTNKNILGIHSLGKWWHSNCCNNSTTTELLTQQVSYNTIPTTGKAALLTTNFQSRTAVLLQEDNIPPATRKLGITKMNQGSGRLVKMVTAHTRQGTFKNTVNKMCQPPKDHIHYSIELL